MAKELGARILAGEYAYVGTDEDGTPQLAMLDVGRSNPRRDDRRDDRHDRKEDRWERNADDRGRAPSGPRLVPQKPNVSQIKIFAHGVQDVGAGDPLVFSVQSLVPFRPTRGVMSAEVSLDDVEMEDIKVANRSQLASSSVFPGQMFSPQAQEVYVDLDVLSSAIPFFANGSTISAQRCVLGWYGNLFEVAQL